MVIIQQLISGSMLGGIYVMVAVAFTLVIGMLNFLNFTIPPIFMLSAMVSWAVAKFGLPFGIMAPPVHWLFALIVGIFVAIIASLIVERFTYRYLKNRYGDATEHAIPLVSSIGFLLIFTNVVIIYFGSEPQSFPMPFDDVSLKFNGLVLGIPQLISLLVSFGIVWFLSYLLKTTKTGRILRSIAESPDTALLLGVKVFAIVPIIFLIVGFLCGLSSALFTVNYSEVSAFIGDEVAAKAIAGMVIGGLGNIWGAVAGGLLVGILEVLSIHFFGADTVKITVWGALLIILIIKPQGIFGHVKIGKEKF
ncbi:branched-chain amino acid ABC transporter permease [Alphaproteobacteria bacterium]|nr:branched-chain amino acid ABC transporter permease [Alphaproteobacteria bacterium]